MNEDRSSGVPFCIGPYSYDIRYSIERPRLTEGASEDAKPRYVTHAVLWSVLPLIVSALGSISAYAVHLGFQAKETAVQEAHITRELAYKAIATAKEARPDPFTGTMANQMKNELIERDSAIIARCAENITRLDKYDDKLDNAHDALRREIQAAEARCVARLHGVRP